MMVAGGPTQVHISPITAAGMFDMSTLGTPGPVMGLPTCGIGGVPGVTIGQVCISVMRAAGLLMQKHSLMLMSSVWDRVVNYQRTAPIAKD